MTVLFHTLGCKVNQYDTQTIRELFAAEGIYEAAEDDIPSIIIINSCTVTAESDRKTRQAVGHFRRLYPVAVIAVTGCMPQARPEKSKTLQGADIVIGNALNNKLPQLCKDFLINRERVVLSAPHKKGDEISPLCENSFEGRTRAFVKIEDGCNRFCSYCIIPYARGRVRSRKPAEIVSELKALADNGYSEVVLAGINLSAYGSDIGLNLCDAVEAAAKTDNIKRIRLGSLEPDQLTPEIISRLSQCSKLCGQFHLSLQSGCDTVLKRMNRHYDTAFYSTLVDNLRKLFPDCSITTDIMTGFAGETDEEFAQTLKYVEKIGFAKVHVFPYSRREGTPAAEMDGQIPQKIKSERAKILIRTAEKTADEFFASQLGKVFNVLFEQRKKDGSFEGYTESYIPVRLESTDELCGRILPIRLVSLNDGACTGEIVSPNA